MRVCDNNQHAKETNNLFILNARMQGMGASKGMKKAGKKWEIEGKNQQECLRADLDFPRQQSGKEMSFVWVYALKNHVLDVASDVKTWYVTVSMRSMPSVSGGLFSVGILQANVIMMQGSLPSGSLALWCVLVRKSRSRYMCFPKQGLQECKDDE
jgi:hypothetical protein